MFALPCTVHLVCLHSLSLDPAPCTFAFFFANSALQCKGTCETMTLLLQLSDDLVDIILSYVLDLWNLMGARSACIQLKQKINQRFLPVIAPPNLQNIPVMSMAEHGEFLMRLFGTYRKWIRDWSEIYYRMDNIEARHYYYVYAKVMRDNSCSDMDGFFSLAPWSRIPGETVSPVWRTQQWLHNAVYDAHDNPSPGKSRFYQCRKRDEEEDDRVFFTTPAGVLVSSAADMAKRFVIQPINIRKKDGSRYAKLPDLQESSLAALRVVEALIRAYIPSREVIVETVAEHVPAVKGRMTRADVQGARREDGTVVTQLATSALLGARRDSDTRDLSRGHTFTTYVIAPHMFQTTHTGAGKLVPDAHLAWCLSSPLEKEEEPYMEDSHPCVDDAFDAWVISTHQVEAFFDDERDKTHVICSTALYCVLTEGVGLDICENLECVMNCSNGVHEARSTSLLLCPTCMRKLHLRGIIVDVPSCRERVESVLAQAGLL